MNYWPAEVCNLTECAEPLFTMIMELSQTGRKTARDFFGVEGWLLGFNTDIWRNTSPIGGGTFGSWSTGGAWPNGSVQGLCARGGFEVDIAWEDGKVTGATIRSKLGNPCKVRYGDIIVDYKTKVGESIKLNGKLQRN